MAKQYVMDMTKGNETSLLLRFTLPMLVGNIFQQFYNMVDSIIVGRFVGTNALGAVGSVGCITFMFFSLCLGLGSGIGILIFSLLMILVMWLFGEPIVRIGFAFLFMMIPAVGMWGVWYTNGLTWTLTGLVNVIRVLQGKWVTKAVVNNGSGEAHN